jgi:hypothetical protein
VRTQLRTRRHRHDTRCPVNPVRLTIRSPNGAPPPRAGTIRLRFSAASGVRPWARANVATSKTVPRRRPEDPDHTELAALIARATGAARVELGERVQKLWSGYGEIRRATLVGSSTTPVIVKWVVPPPGTTHDDAEARSHRRKLRSYEVERAFYRRYAGRCGPVARVASALHVGGNGNRTLFVLEDLDASGFAVRHHRVSEGELAQCLRWLAHFHARFLGVQPDSLWNVGTYWHLATRPDELAAVRDVAIRRAAPVLDERLNRARFRTLVHGDAKLQNFCFSAGGDAVAAVDFQYVGGGVGVKDVAYCLTSCLTPRELERDAPKHLNTYFRELRAALDARDIGQAPETSPEELDADAIEAEWRELYPLACADFYRFLLGWAGGVESRDAYLEGVTRRVLAGIAPT